MDSSLHWDARLSSIIAGQEWIWSTVRSPEWIELIRCTSYSLLPNYRRRDVVCWKDALQGVFSILYVLDVEWWALVWHKQAIPAILLHLMTCYP